MSTDTKKSTNNKLKVAAIGDLHVRENSHGSYKDLFETISKKADVLVLTGDLTDLGIPEEAKVLLEELQVVNIPILGVFGNHDYQSNNIQQIKKILTSDNKMVDLEDGPVEIDGVGFAGTKGFAGGFDNHMLGAFGEDPIKQFVQESLNHELKLENSLNSLHSEKKVVVLHYSPIRQTVVGESEEIFPFLGSSRLEEPIDHFKVNVVFHGHSHFGTIKGQTAKGVPVYNVALPLLQKVQPKEPFVVFEI